MSNPERTGQSFTEEIAIEQTDKAVILTTTAVKKEAFISVEEVLREKQKEVRKGNIALPFRAIGLAGVFGGAGMAIVERIAEGVHFGPENVDKSLTAVVVGSVLILSTQKYLDRGKLARKQIDKIQSIMQKDPTSEQKLR